MPERTDSKRMEWLGLHAKITFWRNTKSKFVFDRMHPLTAHLYAPDGMRTVHERGVAGFGVNRWREIIDAAMDAEGGGE